MPMRLRRMGMRTYGKIYTYTEEEKAGWYQPWMKLVTDFDALYDSVSERSRKLTNLEENNRDVQHESLAPQLRPYQIEAVKWMLDNELNYPGKGGILADEMGLGKTVEVLALILNHTRTGDSKNLTPETTESEPSPSENAKLSEKQPEASASGCEGCPSVKVEITESVTPLSKRARQSGKESEATASGCEVCSSKTMSQCIENVIWRFSPDSTKSSIQGVIDSNCVDISYSKSCSCDKKSIRERLDATYRQELEQYSGLKSLQKIEKPVAAAENSGIFLCLCGNSPGAVQSSLVECTQCSKKQHSSCVRYNTQDPQKEEYVCPRCWTDKELIPSGATLIITPASILHQWVEEIRRHVRPDRRDKLRVLVYKGVSCQGYHQPAWIARNHDIIITTYEVLRKEIHFALAGGEERSRRVAATYMVPPSPLLSVQYWRLVLDEAQMVEGATTRVADMAKKFQVVHKWAVTGTPIQKSVEDLTKLFEFLDIKVTYKWLFHDEKALADLLAPIFWRTKKSKVADEIGLPPQTEETHWLTFSPIEEYFYGQQATQCTKDALQRLQKFELDKYFQNGMNRSLDSMDASTVKALLFPILRLRQACVHPQMVRGQFLTMRAQSKTLTMEELLRTLIKRAHVECDDAHRLRVSAVNGQAAIHIIKKEFALAVEKYRDVLRWAEELKDSVSTDTIQRLHTVHNLAEVLRTCPKDTAIPPTLRDGKLEEEAESLRQKYLERAQAGVDLALATLAPISASVGQISGELDANREKLDDMWWTAALEWAEQSLLSDKLVTDVKEKLAGSGPNQSKIPQFSRTDGLKFLLFSRLEEMGEKRNEVMSRLRTLELNSPEELSGRAADCHLRPGPGGRAKKSDRCPLCLAQDLIEDYESLLFAMDERNRAVAAATAAAEDEEEEADQDFPTTEDEEEGAPAVLEQLRRGTWADSQAEKMLKIILSFVRKHRCPNAEIQQGGQIHLKLLDTWKKEFRQLRVVWRQMNDRASAVDELAMATIRLRLRLPHEAPANQADSQVYLLDPHEVDIQYAKLQGDLVSASNALRRHMGQVLYLKNLEEAGFGRTGKQNPDPCPICTNSLGTSWSVLPCGHCFCMECIRLMTERRRVNIRCAICRELMELGDISYVGMPQQPEEEPEKGSLLSIRVKGSHSTKVEAIVRQLLWIRAREPDAKCLVFSTWSDVLLIVSRALDENNIPHSSMVGAQKRVMELERFKKDPSVLALLLTIDAGANGLNLIEATHVLLMEPVMNPGSELQAIGRVHRIGQTRPTVVHRFLVKRTIEEKMATMLEVHRASLSSRSGRSAKENPVTLADLKALFHDDPQPLENDAEELVE